MSKPYRVPPPQESRPMPDDFLDHIHRSYGQLARHYAAGYSTLCRWIRESGIDRSHVVPDRKTPLPEDYVTRTARLSERAAARLCGASKDTIKRWDSETGIIRPKRSPRKSRAVVKEGPVRRVSTVPTFMTQPVDRPYVDISPAGQAADYMRHFIPVYRCTALGRAVDALIDGKPNRDATHWRCGNAIVTSAELIERAESKRRREAERRLAA